MTRIVTVKLGILVVKIYARKLLLLILARVLTVTPTNDAQMENVLESAKMFLAQTKHNVEEVFAIQLTQYVQVMLNALQANFVLMPDAGSLFMIVA